jgi:hypothetical protein
MYQAQGDKFGRKFVIEFIDSLTGCICHESIFETDDIVGLCEIIDTESCEIHPAAAYDLDPCDVEKIAVRYGLIGDRPSTSARLRPWRPLDELPYKIHTNRELALMVAEGKPFAAFSESYPSNPEYEFIPERFFEPYVKNGLLVKREYVLLMTSGRKSRIVLYARKSEEWRIDAYILLRSTAEKSGWNEGFERIEGTLLGYEEWQNDIYIERIYKRRN